MTKICQELLTDPFFGTNLTCGEIFVNAKNCGPVIINLIFFICFCFLFVFYLKKIPVGQSAGQRVAIAEKVASLDPSIIKIKIQKLLEAPDLTIEAAKRLHIVLFSVILILSFVNIVILCLEKKK